MLVNGQNLASAYSGDSFSSSVRPAIADPLTESAGNRCEVTIAKIACGSRGLVFAIPSVVGLSVAGPCPSEARWPVAV